MKEFPAKFVPKNLANFQQYQYDRDTCYLREAIYEHFLKERPAPPEGKKDSKEEKQIEDQERKTLRPYELPFDLESFERARSPPDLNKMVAEICKELETLGWKTKIGFKNSALWVYPPDQVPKSLPEW